MPKDDDTDLEQRGSLKCETCERVMELVKLEPYGTHRRASLHTFQCISCGETAEIVVTQM